MNSSQISRSKVTKRVLNVKSLPLMLIAGDEVILVQPWEGEDGMEIEKKGAKASQPIHPMFKDEVRKELPPVKFGRRAEDIVVTKEARTPKTDITNESTVKNPCKLVWAIADEMQKTHPHAKRKDILEVCVKRGIAYYTARTQYQQWLGVQKEMATREAEKKGKNKK